MKAVAVVSMSNPAVAPCMPRMRKTEAPRSSSSRTVKFFSDAPGIAAIFSRTSLTVASEAGSILTEAEVTNALSLALEVELDIWTTRSLAVITPRPGRSREYFPPEVVVFARAETCEPESLIRIRSTRVPSGTVAIPDIAALADEKNRSDAFAKRLLSVSRAMAPPGADTVPDTTMLAGTRGG